MSVALDNKTHAFLDQYFKNDQIKIHQLAGDASARKYYRIIHNQDTYVLMSWLPFDAEKYPFIDILRHFELANVHVPKIKKIGAEQGLILLEDLGDLTLERKFWESSQQELSWHFYKKYLILCWAQLILKLQGIKFVDRYNAMVSSSSLSGLYQYDLLFFLHTKSHQIFARLQDA